MTLLQPQPVVARSERWFHGIVAGLLAVMFAASLLGVDRWELLTPSNVPDEATSICMMRRLTWLPCPTCGLTRSFCDISRGCLGEAIVQHPLGPLFYALFALLLVRSTLIAATGRPVMNRLARVLVYMIPLFIILLVMAWIVRLLLLATSGDMAELWRQSPLGRWISG